MPWFRVDDKLGEHPKVRAIPRGKRRNAMGLWILAGPWCCLNLTDGNVPGYMLEELCSKPSDAAELVRSGLWHESGHNCPDCPQPSDTDGYIFHDWCSLQFSRDQVISKREREAKRQQEWRDRKRAEKEAQSRDRNGVTEMYDPVSHAPVRDSRPVPSRPELLSTERGERQVTLRAAEPTGPTPKSAADARCSAHIGVADPGPCKGCKRAREQAEKEIEREAEAIARAAEAQARNCQLCEGTHFVLDENKRPTKRRCDHRRSA